MAKKFDSHNERAKSHFRQIFFYRVKHICQLHFFSNKFPAQALQEFIFTFYQQLIECAHRTAVRLNMYLCSCH